MRTSLACMSMLLAPAAVWAAVEPSPALHALFEERYQWQLREEPDWAMSKGDYRHADRIRDRSLAAIERRHGETVALLERLRALDRARLSSEDQLNYDLFEWLLRSAVERHRFRTFLMPIGARGGLHVDVAQMHERVRFASEQDYENYLKRLEQVPKSVDDVIALAQLGISEGRTWPQVILAGVPAQFDALLTSGLDALREPLREMRGVPEERQAALRARFDTSTLPALRAGLERLRDFVVREYIPRCRTSIAAADLPDGPAYYETELRYFTTTTLSPQEIHELGLREVARIRREMLDVIRATDFDRVRPAAAQLGDDARLRAFFEYLRTEPRFYYTKPEDLLRGYRDLCKRIDAELPRLFTVLPRLTYGVQPVPDWYGPEAATGYFYPGDIRNAQSSTFFVNTYALDQRPRYEMVALALHEAVPGHHFQSQLARELDGLPVFRRELWCEAFGEGWALYAERLGREMGLYADPYDDFGRLLFELWRATRLVVDTGMHALGWSRAQAMDYLRATTALSEANLRAEIDRYIEWPGQATCYKIGELRIRALRARAEQALGERFDLRTFHDMLLSAGTLPLDLLEQRVAAWIVAVPGGTTP